MTRPSVTGVKMLYIVLQNLAQVPIHHVFAQILVGLETSVTRVYFLRDIPLCISQRYLDLLRLISACALFFDPEVQSL